MLKNTKVLSDGVENLRYAKKTAYEAEHMAIDINLNLKKQTDTMEKNITKVYIYEYIYESYKNKKFLA